MQSNSVSVFPSFTQFLVSLCGAFKTGVRERAEKKRGKDLISLVLFADLLWLLNAHTQMVALSWGTLLGSWVIFLGMSSLTSLFCEPLHSSASAFQQNMFWLPGGQPLELNAFMLTPVWLTFCTVLQMAHSGSVGHSFSKHLFSKDTAVSSSSLMRSRAVSMPAEVWGTHLLSS